MREYLTEGVVLDKNPRGEFDFIVVLYTKLLGKIGVKLKSGRKITSRLNCHLEPLNRVLVRIVEKNGLQIVDALSLGKYSLKLINVINLIDNITLEFESDSKLWQILSLIPYNQEPRDVKILIKKILEVSGFDSKFSSCYNCGRAPTHTFIFDSAQFICGLCLNHSQMKVEEVISI